MKKILLSAMVLFAALAVNAESEVGLSTATLTTKDADGNSVNTEVTDEAVQLYAGTYVDWYTGLSDTFKDGGASATVNINGTDVAFAGAVGSNNPSMTSSPQSQGVPTSGGYFTYNVKTDGYLYILAKLNTEKNYIVHEDGTRIPYLWVASCYSTDLPVLSFDLNDIDGALAEDGTISDDYKILTAKDYISDLASESKGVDCQAGVIKFPVKAGSTYTFCGTGTKCAVGGFYFDTTGDATITYTTDDDTYTLLEPTSDEEGDVTDGDDGLVEQCLYTTDFTDWDEVANQDVTVTTSYSQESLVFTLTNADVMPADTSNLEKFGDYEGCIRINTDKGGSDEITTSALNSITKVEVDYGTTAGSRGLYVYSKGDGDSDWELTFDGSNSTQGSHPVTIDVNKENCELKFASSVDNQYVFLISLAIYGKVSSSASESGTTGINNAAIVSSNVENGAIYNLAGQRLSKLTKGINIVNGKKIFVK